MIRALRVFWGNSRIPLEQLHNDFEDTRAHRIITGEPMHDRRVDTASRAAPAPPRWKGAQSISPVYQLNERCIELLCEVAASSSALDALSLVEELRDLWANLDLEARRRAARVPFAIVEARFQDEPWWRHVAASGDTNPALDEGCCSSTNCLPKEASEQLMHETLMFAWQTVRWDRTVSLVSFGMSPSVADVIAALTPRQIRMISTRFHHCVVVRWSEDSQFWRDLLVAAATGNEEKLGELHLLAKLSYCGALV
jgi:hypothetical protein